ncbi:MAG: homoserine dehydrogenase [Firmicutes bacterium]|nr:homoserine dehydrogenase [Bacillota bacterium]
MIYAAILGHGTVGSGVFDIFCDNGSVIDKNVGEEMRVKYVLDLRDFEGEKVQEFITHDFEEILNDDEVKVVAEVMGGLKPAYDFVKKLLEKGKAVVTSNKELVAAHGDELIRTARENNTNFLFEASVGGGIPIIRPLHNALTADNILEIKGILNGTTNYMLTKMTQEGLEYDDILKEAQEKGYAERNPAADVEGFDACRKIAILASIMTGKKVDYSDIHTEGITNISKTDIDYIKKMGKAIKLIGRAKKTENGVEAWVAPMILDNEDPLSGVNDVFNAILVKGDMVDDVMFYGKGAGKLPTASAVTADMVEAAKNIGKNIGGGWSSEGVKVEDIDNIDMSKFIRCEYTDREKAEKLVRSIFKNIDMTDIGKENEFAFVTPKEKEAEINNKINILINDESVSAISNTIRFER